MNSVPSFTTKPFFIFSCCIYTLASFSPVDRIVSFRSRRKFIPSHPDIPSNWEHLTSNRTNRQQTESDTKGRLDLTAILFAICDTYRILFMSTNNHSSLVEPMASNTDTTSSLTPDQPQNPHVSALVLDLASNKNLLIVLQTGTAARARRRQRSASTPPQDLLAPSSIGLERSLTSLPPTQSVYDGYQSSDDSLHLPPSSTCQRHARANAPFLPPLPGHSAVHVAVEVASAGVPHDVVAAPAAASSSTQQIRRNSSSSVSSAFSWQESIFHVRRLSDDVFDVQLHTPTLAPRAEHGGRALVPPPRHGSRPHPEPLRSNPVFEGGWI